MNSKMAYQGFSYECGIPTNTKFSNGKNNFSCTLTSICPPGEFPEIDDSMIRLEAERLQSWAASVGFEDTYSTKYECLSKSAVSTVAFTMPNTHFQGPDLAFSYCIWCLFAIDDIFDFHLKKDENFLPRLQFAFDTFESILKGDYKKYENNCLDQNNQVGDSILNFKPLCQALIEVDKILSSSIQNYYKVNTNFVKAMRGFLDALLWSYERDDFETCSESTFTYFRNHYGGFYVVPEIIVLINGVNLPQEMRDNVEFGKYLIAITTSMAIANDILSLGKEMTDGHTDNFVIHKVMNKKISLDDAIKETVTFTNKETHEARVYCGRLIRDNPMDLELKKYFRLVNVSHEGHLKWYAYGTRYGEISIKSTLIGQEEYDQLKM